MSTKSKWTKSQSDTLTTDGAAPLLAARHLRWRPRSSDLVQAPWRKRPLRRLGRRLGVLAVTLMSPSLAEAAGLPGCTSGFTQVAQTKSELTCLRTEKAASEADADDLSKSIDNKKGCDGKVTEQRASVADGADGGWLVTMLFSCADGD